jgi:hypothetical protein
MLLSPVTSVHVHVADHDHDYDYDYDYDCDYELLGYAHVHATLPLSTGPWPPFGQELGLGAQNGAGGMHGGGMHPWVAPPAPPEQSPLMVLGGHVPASVASMHAGKTPPQHG